MDEKEIEQKIAEAKTAAHVTEALVVELQDDLGVAAFRSPTTGEWDRYRTESSDTNPAVKSAAAKPLVATCCIYPDREAFGKMIAAHPGIVESFVGELVEYAGANRVKKARKL